MSSRFVVYSVALAFLVGCKAKEPAVPLAPEPPVTEVEEEAQPRTRPVYQATRTTLFDLRHTELQVRFDWANQHVLGKARLTLSPRFYPQDSLTLDAKGLEVTAVQLLVNDSTQTKLAFDSQPNHLHIQLDRTYYRSDSLRLEIDYVGKPNEREAGGSAAITSDKGLYFINPLNEVEDKPQQIWTQGETEANSCWFPTIDAPNQRMTQELYITVNNRFKTLSNGTLIYSIENPDSTRTDYWQQKTAHAPYLTMMAIGEFSVVKDSLDELDVHYYVEPEYEPHARAIFGNTPEMIQFYSDVLGMDYPWEKYHQVVVRDYVSGAMENTSAVIFGDFVQQTTRELLDGDHEDIVAHELFHHWFGDWVTCESWSNLPLNESFATYGEYLWIEYKYGREKADEHLQNDLRNYLAESRMKQVDLVRFNYSDKEDMFDSHSYAKGGRVLHMLRKLVGDDAFFRSLNHYLTTHALQAVEIHDLRLSFEEVTGKDFNWFFNQWFLASGHPTLNISYDWNDSLKKQTVTIEQLQGEPTPLYRLPMAIDLYVQGRKTRHNIVLDQETQSFVFPCTAQPDLVNVDAEKMLLCKKKDNKPQPMFRYQYKNAPLYLDRYEAVRAFLDVTANDTEAQQLILQAMNDAYPGIRSLAISNLEWLSENLDEQIKPILVDLAEGDPDAGVRQRALSALKNRFEPAPFAPLFKLALRDPSYRVMQAGLEGLAIADPELGMEEAKRLVDTDSKQLLYGVATVFAEHGQPSENQFYLNTYPKLTGFGKMGFVSSYGAFQVRLKNEQALKDGLWVFEDLASSSSRWLRFGGIQNLMYLYESFQNERNALQEQIDKEEAMEQPDVSLIEMRKTAEHLDALLAAVKSSAKTLAEKEEDDYLRKALEEALH